jgi:hypothetical protein
MKNGTIQLGLTVAQLCSGSPSRGPANQAQARPLGRPKPAGEHWSVHGARSPCMGAASAHMVARLPMAHRRRKADQT